MTTTPLPRKPTGKLAFAYNTIASLEQARADLEAENKRLREVVEFVAKHKSSDGPERCQQMVDIARNVLRGRPWPSLL